MCFSAEASFTAALVLGVVGGATLKSINSRSEFFLASIPFLFAIQQFSEGLIWMHLEYQWGSKELYISSQQAFLVFAFLIWPIWIPLSLLKVEKIPWRRQLLFLFLAGGVILALVNLSFGLQTDFTVQIINHSLQYRGQSPKQTFIYPLIVLLPCFVSSLKKASLFGCLALFAYIIADYFYTHTFASVWCFFAAIMSLSIYKIIKNNQVSLEKNLL